MEGTDWRTHQPPLELFNVPAGTSMEIESIIEPSLDKLQNILAEEESLRQDVAALRREREANKEKEPMFIVAGDSSNSHEGLEVHTVSIHMLHFLGICSSDNVQPCSSTDIHNNGLDGNAVLAQNELPVSISSSSMASSGDSGYGSRSSDPLPPKSRMGNIFSLRGTLRRSKNRISGVRQGSAAILTKWVYLKSLEQQLNIVGNASRVLTTLDQRMWYNLAAIATVSHVSRHSLGIYALITVSNS